MTSHRCPILILRFVTMLLYMEKKKKFTDMINLKILRWRNYPGGPNLITKVLKRGSRKVKVRGKDVQMEVEVKVLQP